MLTSNLSSFFYNNDTSSTYTILIHDYQNMLQVYITFSLPFPYYYYTKWDDVLRTYFKMFHLITSSTQFSTHCWRYQNSNTFQSLNKELGVAIKMLTSVFSLKRIQLYTQKCKLIFTPSAGARLQLETKTKYCCVAL